ncbi:MAG: 16S rRNA (guanine(527)-N(7))-methyltransferase RsmG [Chloroflexi bacterium]|nr:16S rRNA (guanine(527)-N(7))-methyltransferase RsmG [Chloroflexota bacterium]
MSRAELPSDPSGLPPLPGAFGAALDAGLAALGLGLGAEAGVAIAAHVRLLIAWNDAINLTAITDPATIATRHVLDSLAALPLLVGDAATSAMTLAPPPRIADIGSGGGFPGLVLAATLRGSRVTLIESVAKKARFLQTAAAAMGLTDRVAVRALRAEELAAREPAARDVVTARAVAGLAELVELALPLLRVGGRLLAWKGSDIEAELAAAGRASRALGGDAPASHEISGIPALAGHRIVVVRKVAATPPGFPRDPARRKRQPW